MLSFLELCILVVFRDNSYGLWEPICHVFGVAQFLNHAQEAYYPPKRRRKGTDRATETLNPNRSRSKFLFQVKGPRVGLCGVRTSADAAPRDRGTVPLQEFFWDLVIGLAAKWVGVQQSLDNLLAHKARKTWPPSLIGVHFPKLELTAEFAATNPSGLGEVKETYDKFRGLVLDKHIEVKTSEAKWLDEQIAPKHSAPPLLSLLTQHYGLLMKDYRDLKGETPVKDDHGNTIRIEPVFAESALFKKEFDNLLVDLPILASRVITLERNRYYEAKAKRAAKESLRQETDVVMGDLTTDNAAAIIDARVNSVLEKRLRSMRLVGGKGARGVSKVGPASSNIKSTKQTPKLKPATQKKSGGGPSRPRQPSSNKSPKPQAKASSSASRKGKGKQRQ
ncbi:hypothetical protein BDZ97DRAFT_1763842 [Flammula alnicola]|nr:hypothetical protein BDZ97DRAFT_1763842 [Flammula alnicola]